MNEFNPLPPLSLETEKFLAEHKFMNAEPTLPSSPSTYDDTDYDDADSTQNVKTQESVDFPIVDNSVISEIGAELQECVRSLDDQLLEETNAAMEQNRSWFQQQLQEIEKEEKRKLELIEERKEMKLKQEQEREMLTELRMLANNNSV